MHEKIKDAFAQIHASDTLKENTRAFLRQKSRGYTKQQHLFCRMIPAAACFLFLLFGAYSLYFTPTATISIDVNPSIELNVNRFDRVVGVIAYNADGEQLAESLDVDNMEYTAAVDQVLANDQIIERLSAEETLTISVVGSDDAQASRILENMERCTSQMKNAYCYRMQEEDVEGAHEAGLSYGKYRAYLELHALDPNVTTADVQGMTMRQIRDRIDKLSGGQAADSDTKEEQSGQGHRYGAQRADREK